MACDVVGRNVGVQALLLNQPRQHSDSPELPCPDKAIGIPTMYPEPRPARAPHSSVRVGECAASGPAVTQVDFAVEYFVRVRFVGIGAVAWPDTALVSPMSQTLANGKFEGAGPVAPVRERTHRGCGHSSRGRGCGVCDAKNRLEHNDGCTFKADGVRKRVTGSFSAKYSR
ncbi:hypothetical protein BKA81DRAFT_383308 [Phyllosticta paracitricarpa]